MAIIKEVTNAEMPGILMPILQNRWKLVIPMLGEDAIFPIQVVSCRLKLLTSKFHVKLEQSTKAQQYNELTDLVEASAKRNYGFDVELYALNGDNVPYHKIVLQHTKLTDCTTDFNYAANGIVVHDIEFSYRTLIPYQ